MPFSQPGQKYRDFLLVKVTFIEELQSTLRELVHVPSGAQIMQIETDDPENLFCLSFKTLPTSGNGAPHILEHTVLCGSRKYPVKDPFFAMSRRSLNTFMNALTGSDFTCYPASSQVEKDYFNLLEVYLDAVFHPLLKEESFLQEGHRLSFTKPKDPSSPLEIKGIVYNEMKGSMSSIDSHIWHLIMTHLVPDLPYSHNSGGDPKEIPKLKFTDLINFYETFYHPSRCLFFFYGNLPLEKNLDFIWENSLKKAQRLPPLPEIPLQKRFKKTHVGSYTYPLQESKDIEKQHIHTFSLLTAPLLQQEDVLSIIVLDSILMDTDASPLKKALLDSELCVQADSSIDTEMSELPYVMICRGCEKDAAPKLLACIEKTLREIIEKGIPFEKIESSIHQLEFARTEIGGDHSPFGLTLFMRAALGKQHGCAPERALIIHSLFAGLLERASDPFCFNPIIEKYFLNNTHRVHLSFAPDADFTTKQIDEEKRELATLKKTLTEKQIAHILDQTEALSVYQKMVEGQKLDCLPKVTLQDVPHNIRSYPLHTKNVGQLEVFHTPTFTNGIIYADLLFDLPALTEEELFLLQLFLALWPELGAGQRSYTENLAYIHAHTGGIGAGCSLHVQATHPSHCKPSLQLRSRALHRKAPQLFTLMRETVEGARFNEKKRIQELIRKMANSLKGRLSRNAMRYAVQTALSGFSTPSHISEIWYGLTFYHKLQDLSQGLSKRLPAFLEQLTSLKDKLLTVPNPHLVLSCEEKIYHTLEKEGFYGLSHLLARPGRHWANNYPVPPVPSQARPISSPVAFNAMAMRAPAYLDPDAPALLVSTLLMENKFLLHRIREQGGAYGAGATYNPNWGTFTFNSYRDPHIAHSLHTFTHAIDEVASGQFDENDLEEAKIGIIQQLDVPTAPGARALESYNYQRDGKTDAMRQHFRNQLLVVSKEQLKNAVEKQLKGQQGVVAVYAGKEQIEKENAKLAEEGKGLTVLPI